MEEHHRHLPWVVGRLVIVDRRRPEIAPRGNILLVEAPIPEAEGDLWIVQGEYSNVSHLLRNLNSNLSLIGRFDGYTGGRGNQGVNVEQSTGQTVLTTDGQRQLEPDIQSSTGDREKFAKKRSPIKRASEYVRIFFNILMSVVPIVFRMVWF